MPIHKRSQTSRGNMQLLQPHFIKPESDRVEIKSTKGDGYHTLYNIPVGLHTIRSIYREYDFSDWRLHGIKLGEYENFHFISFSDVGGGRTRWYYEDKHKMDYEYNRILSEN